MAAAVNGLQYKSTIKSMPFFFLETKKASNLVLQGLKDDQIKKFAVEDNIFQVKTEGRKKAIASVTLNRINVLDEDLLQRLVHGDVETGKLIVLYAIMKTDRLFFEFMNEVFREKLIIKDYKITDKDYNLFFDRKKEQSERVGAWADSTFFKLKQVYNRILFEAGLIKINKDRKIVKPFLDQSLIDHFKSKDEEVIIKILLGLN